MLVHMFPPLLGKSAYLGDPPLLNPPLDTQERNTRIQQTDANEHSKQTHTHTQTRQTDTKFLPKDGQEQLGRGAHERHRLGGGGAVREEPLQGKVSLSLYTYIYIYI